MIQPLIYERLFFFNTIRASSCIGTRGLVTRCPRPKHILPRIIRNDCDGGDTSIGTDQIGRKFSAPEVFRPKPDKLRGRGVILTSSRVIWSKKVSADFGTQPPSILSSSLQNPQKTNQSPVQISMSVPVMNHIIICIIYPRLPRFNLRWAKRFHPFHQYLRLELLEFDAVLGVLGVRTLESFSFNCRTSWSKKKPHMAKHWV